MNIDKFVGYFVIPIAVALAGIMHMSNPPMVLVIILTAILGFCIPVMIHYDRKERFSRRVK